jgi:hypothetical protein
VELLQIKVDKPLQLFLEVCGDDKIPQDAYFDAEVTEYELIDGKRFAPIGGLTFRFEGAK